MKVLKWVLVLVGLVGLVAAGIFLGLNWVDMGKLLSAANANKSGNLFPDPMPRLYLTAGLGAVGGLLFGLGLGLPSRTAGTIRRQTLDEVAAKRSDAIASRAAAQELPKDPA